ncbi:MAG: hypothetical protein IJP59_06805 [Muribaculaceae bacterium]|nr:hypothetical protein [Muribaculaceae bacterium]
MTRILRLLLIAAVAWPLSHPAAAQEVKPEVETKSVKEMLKNDASSAVSTVASDEIVLKTEAKSGNTLASPTKRGQKSSTGGKAPKAISTKADQVTVTPPSSATIEEWAIDGTFYYYNSGWQTVTDYSSYSSTPIQVAIDGNDIYISGLCPQFASGWVKGTISGTTATFATAQYYGTNNDSEYWFVGEDSNDQECDVVFNYNADAKKLTLATAYICNKSADTGGSYYSYFTSLVLQKPEGATVCNGTESNEYVPVYGYWLDTSGTESQMIYPSSLFSDLQAGDRIESITFYTLTSSTSTVPDNLGSATVQVRMGETTETAITSSTYQGNRTNATVVYEGTLTTGANTMTITFDQPYIYEGKNLVIDTYVTNGVSGKYAHCYWAGVSASQGASAYYRSSFNPLSYLPKMTMVWTAAVPDVALDFETVEVGSSKTLNAVVKNPESQSVTATLTTSAPFSVQSSSMTMTSGNNVIPVTFTPTDATVYNGILTIDMNGVTTTIDLKGIGNVTGSPAALRDSTFFAGINYDWTDSEGNTHTSSLDEIATDPDQMIAMIREVYTNRTIPGNFTRGYTTGRVAEGDAVNYGGVGTISATVSSSTISYSYEDGYGWGIPGDLETSSSTSSISSSMYGTAYYSYMNPTQYKPYNEGVTLLLVEMVDDFNKANIYDTEETEPYKQLRDYISNSIKSIRVVSQATRTGVGTDEAGTLFKVDCDKMNKFYFMAKGQLRWIYNSVFAEDTDGDYLRGLFCADPCYIYNSSSYNSIDGFFDDRSFALFYNMFEEFSPVANDASAAKADIYQDLVNMESFNVEHDCMGVPLMGHQFMMYGEQSDAADCQDVRDLMFLVPDYRMMSWNGRDNTNNPNYQKFMNYNTTYPPKMGLYVIRQDEIQGAQVSGKDMYKLTLTWDSNLDDFLPSDQQVYELLQVVIDENGVEQYVPVYYMNSNGEYTDKNGNVVTTPVPIELTLNPNDSKTYTEVYVPMQQSSHQVTYAVRGQDISKFLNLKVSNKQDYIIPGLDPNEMIKLTDVTHYSRFNAQTVNNCYSNRLQMTNNALGLNNKIIVDGENGTKLTVIRSHVENVNGENTTIDEPIATITFNNHNSSSRAWTVTMNMDTQSANTEFPAGQSDVEAENVQYYAGYHANPGNTWSNSYSVASDGNITLSPAIIIFDNFVVDVSENAHPNSYSYKVETNYPGVVYLNTNNGTDYTNGAVWYAWTWNTAGEDEEWIRGRATNQTGQYMFTPLKNNFIFVRMNPTGAPSWDAKWNQTGDLTAQGDTYTITGWGSGDMTGSWSGSNEAANSNDIRISVFKTDSRINGVFNKAQVDGDVTGYMEIDENLAFEAKVQYSSKTEILRYDAYRWGETEDRYIVDKVRNYDDEDDIAPAGIAGNQDGSYTVSMNEVGTADYYTTSVTVASGENDKWAKFVDFVPSNQTVGTAYTYAPVVELFATGKDVNNKTREDYNTYGGPLQNAAMGKLAISLVEPTSSNPLMSEYKWQDENGNWYAYYNIKFNVDTKSVPPGYDIYKIRAWREIDESLLGEQYDECSDRVSESYKFEELTYPDYDKNDTYVLGSKPVIMDIEGHEIPIEGNYTGTFGARKLRTSDDETGVIEELDACFFVRIYFTRKSNLEDGQKGSRAGQEPELPADGKYYVVEASYDFVAEGGEDVPTGVIKNLNVRQVVSEKYYNAAGIESDKPFQGVNIVVTRYSDGSATTRKVLK